MADAISYESPLIGCFRVSHSTTDPGQAGVLLSERAMLGHINLRGNPADTAFMQGVAGVLGYELPTAPNTVAAGGDSHALWLGPDEWLLLTPTDSEVDWVKRLEQALAGCVASVNGIGGGQTVIAISGGQVRDVLAKGCPLDLHPAVFTVGQCAQTHVAKAAVLLWPRDLTGIDVIVRRSFADYLWTWLEDAAEEYGLSVLKHA
jgi:sarcosine oxidase subunit gamma